MMMDTILLKQWLLKTVIRSDGFYNNRCSILPWWRHYPQEYTAIFEATKFFNPSVVIKERIYAILNDLTFVPVCPSCGKPVRLDKTKYLTYCSSKCAAVNNST